MTRNRPKFSSRPRSSRTWIRLRGGISALAPSPNVSRRGAIHRPLRSWPWDGAQFPTVDLSSPRQLVILKRCPVQRTDETGAGQRQTHFHLNPRLWLTLSMPFFLLLRRSFGCHFGRGAGFERAVTAGGRKSLRNRDNRS